MRVGGLVLQCRSVARCRWFHFTDVCYQPTSLEERKQLTSELLPQKLLAAIPVAIDTMENTAETLFAAWPERLCV